MEQSIRAHRVAHQQQRPLDSIIGIWLKAKAGRSGSINTYRNYSDQIRWFREWLHERNVDLDDPDPVRLAEEAQAWAIRDKPAQSTYNHRLSTISSFYRYARQRRLLLVENPIEFLDRAVVPAYPDPKALEFDEVRDRLAAIERNTLRGKRDFALLVVALTTGRRRAELVQLRLGDVEIAGERVTLLWRRCKGGKVMRDTLSTPARHALLDYLHLLYGPDLTEVAPGSGVWVSVAAHNQGAPLASTAIFRICRDRLGITAVHRLRHTFAKGMEEAGAKPSDIQASLGHSNLATTSIYLAALRRVENPHSQALAGLFGIRDQTEAVATPTRVVMCARCGNALDVFASSDPNRKYCSTSCAIAAERQRRDRHSPGREAKLESQDLNDMSPSDPLGGRFLQQQELLLEVSL